MCENELIENKVISEEELIELLNETVIEIDTEELNGLKLDDVEFKKGLVDVSRIAGQFIGLKGVGMTSSEALDVLVNMQNIDFNRAMNKDTIEGNINTAKIQGIQLQQQTI